MTNTVFKTGQIGQNIFKAMENHGVIPNSKTNL